MDAALWEKNGQDIYEVSYQNLLLSSIILLEN